jgi:predicted RNase H-like HicB family nuclease
MRTSQTRTSPRKASTLSVVRRPSRGKRLPLLIQKGEDGWYVVECPTLPGCYTQGRTLDEAMKNIHEVIDLVLEEKSARDIPKDYRPVEIGLHTITV